MSETDQPVWWHIPEEGTHHAHCHENIKTCTTPTLWKRLLSQITAHSSKTKDYTKLLQGSDSIKYLTPLSHISLFSHLFCFSNDVLY
jgi:hypothetical protein